jgi:acetylornithine deacetylase
MQVGLIRGGVALNIVPDLCDVQFEMRLLPGADPQPWLDRLREEATRLCAATPHARIEIETLNAYPGLDTSENVTFLRDIMRITGDNRASRIGFGTEGGLFNDYLNMPVVVCGPGSIDRAHKADEFILPEELDAGELFVKRIVETLL